MAELYLVRHGQASFGKKNYDKLSELGKQQAVWLGEDFKERGLSFDHMLRGSLVRHDETLSGIVEGMNTEFSSLEVLEELNEFNFHSIMHAYIEQHPEKALNEHATPKDYYHLLKQSMKAWAADQLTGELSESWESFSNRVKKALTHIQDNCTGNVLIVSSGGVIAMALSHVLSTSAETVVELNLQTKNSSVSHFFFNKNAMRLTSFNNTPHLDTGERREAITFS